MIFETQHDFLYTLRSMKRPLQKSTWGLQKSTHGFHTHTHTLTSAFIAFWSALMAMNCAAMDRRDLKLSREVSRIDCKVVRRFYTASFTNCSKTKRLYSWLLTLLRLIILHLDFVISLDLPIALRPVSLFTFLEFTRDYWQIATSYVSIIFLFDATICPSDNASMSRSWPSITELFALCWRAV